MKTIKTFSIEHPSMATKEFWEHILKNAVVIKQDSAPIGFILPAGALPESTRELCGMKVLHFDELMNPHPHLLASEINPLMD